MGTRSVLAAVALLSLGACDDGARSDGATHGVEKQVLLRSAADCDELEQYIEETAIWQMRGALSSGGYYGPWRGGEPVAESEGVNSAGGDKGSAGPRDYTGTNTQVKGVDEADFVKTDGKHIYVLSGERFYVVKSWPAEELSLAASVLIEGWPTEMFLDEEARAVIISTTYTNYEEAASEAEKSYDLHYARWYANGTKVTVIDLADATLPRVVREEYLPGWYTNARRIGSSVRLVLGDSFRWPEDVRWWPEEELDWSDRGAVELAMARLMAQNEKIIRAATLADWVPVSRRALASGEKIELPYACSDFYLSNASTEMGLMTIATLNLDDVAAPMERSTVVAYPGEVYASMEALYVVTPHWWWSLEESSRNGSYSYLHKFDLSHPERAGYVGSGGFDGTVIDQFSMDEHEGYLRVATTVQRFEQRAELGWSSSSLSFLLVIGEEGSELKVVGRSEPLAEGERIYSARFRGERGFIVTFLQTDPLFTFDLSDPLHPRKVGELHVPGFSTYLHPLDENHLLAIGTYLPDPGEGGGVDWTERTLQLSLFDVTDLANPVRTHMEKVGDYNGYSEAQYDHKAFNYFASRKVLAIPLYSWSYTGSSGSNTSELRLFRIDPAEGIAELGRLSMSDLSQTVTYEDGYSWTWTPYVRRSVMADDFAYAISDVGIRVARMDALGSPIATLHLEHAF